jgi:xylulokinase
MADVLQREIRQVEHPIRANARGAALLAGVALGRIGAEDLARNVRITQTFVPDRENVTVYDDRYAEFRVLHKQTSRRTKRHVGRGT